MTPVDAILARLLSLHPKKIDLSLDRMQRLLAQLDHPERKLPPVIHVAGTNGKGSTIAFMRAMLEAAGKRVHVYTSPHLVRFNERFRLNGTLVSDDELTAVLAECEQRNEGESITVFEITTAAALMLFARHPADVLLLEVGLGGRLDATNVVDRPLATVITPVSLDHIDFLGDDIAKIAAEKAGILKRGVPAIIGPQPSNVIDVIEQRAADVRAPLRAIGEEWTAGEERGRLVYQDEQGLLDLPAPRLGGRHQFANAGMAIACLRALPNLGVSPEAIEAGLLGVEWPARMQRLTQGPLLALAPEGSELWLDGGHNPDGGRAIAAALADLEERVSRPLILIVGMLASKDCEGFLGNFAGLARRIIAIPIEQQDNIQPPDSIADAARRVGIPAESRPSLEAALGALTRLALQPAPRILITGSLYLAGQTLAANGMAPE